VLFAASFGLFRTKEFGMTRKGIICLFAGMFLSGILAAQDEDSAPVPGPSFKDVLSLKSVGGAQIAPDGSAIAYTVRSTVWDKNQHDTEIWLVREGEQTFNLTNTID
jgi:hypothetical protein